jgi:hypothetical protein
MIFTALMLPSPAELTGIQYLRKTTFLLTNISF